MRALVAAVLVLGASLPAAAVPLASHAPAVGLPLASGYSFYGLAQQGSEDRSSEWVLQAQTVCPAISFPMRFELQMLAAAPGDEVRIYFPFGDRSETPARLLEPGVVHRVTNYCEPFVVLGSRIGDAALYRLDVLEPLV